MGYLSPGNMPLRSILFISFIIVIKFSWPPSCCIIRGSMQPCVCTPTHSHARAESESAFSDQACPHHARHRQPASQPGGSLVAGAWLERTCSCCIICFGFRFICSCSQFAPLHAIATVSCNITNAMVSHPAARTNSRAQSVTVCHSLSRGTTHSAWMQDAKRLLTFPCLACPSCRPFLRIACAHRLAAGPPAGGARYLLRSA